MKGALRYAHNPKHHFGLHMRGSVSPAPGFLDGQVLLDNSAIVSDTMRIEVQVTEDRVSRLVVFRPDNVGGWHGFYPDLGEFRRLSKALEGNAAGYEGVAKALKSAELPSGQSLWQFWKHGVK